MDISDLMIGDWVSLEGVPVEVTDMGDSHIWFRDGDEWMRASLFGPIPITPEILEMIGLSKVSHEMFMEKRDDGIIAVEDWNEFTRDGHPGWRVRVTVGAFTDVTVRIGHVHELQHALRLCGIVKEIKL